MADGHGKIPTHGRQSQGNPGVSRPVRLAKLLGSGFNREALPEYMMWRVVKEPASTSGFHTHVHIFTCTPTHICALHISKHANVPTHGNIYTYLQHTHTQQEIMKASQDRRGAVSTGTVSPHDWTVESEDADVEGQGETVTVRQ